ncbi:DNA polymerase Y family protein [Acidipropionibacterium timonense]|uniref:DNA polymerase Y family protein n=1 Tax=Acidipropionibacterium timonense TaxID=2161818 RepID=UPI0010311323|nr:DNA polymerase Y family protein [Acidipropionibacterium timonense]
MTGLSTSPARVILVRIPQWRVWSARNHLGRGHSEGSRAEGSRAEEPFDPDVPLLVVDRGRVIACCDRAAEEGVEVGLRTRAAQLRCPDAVVVDHDPQIEAEGFARVVAAIEAGVAPGVHVVRPGVAAVQARGPARFYGSEEAAARRLLEVVRCPDDPGTAGHPGATVAVADGLFAAEQAAALATPLRIVPSGRSRVFLSDLDVAVLGRPDLTTTLHGLGLRTLGLFAELDRADVSSRFGPDGLLCHELARGMDVPVLSPYRPSDDHAVEVVLDDPLASADEIEAAVRPAVEALMAELGATGRVCSEARILVRSTSGLSERTWRQPWLLDADDLVTRVLRQVARVPGSSSATRSPTGWPGVGRPGTGSGEVDEDFCQRGVEAIRIVPTVHSAAEQAEGLFGARPAEHLVHVIARVQGRLGPESVLVPDVVGGRLLKDRRRLTPFGSVPDDRARPVGRPWPGHLDGPAPTIVYDRPPRVEVRAEDGSCLRVDDEFVTGEPVWLTAGGRRCRVVAWAGPWPVHQRWWDAHATRIDRLQVVTDDRQAWVLATSSGTWWAEARYDEG